MKKRRNYPQSNQKTPLTEESLKPVIREAGVPYPDTTLTPEISQNATLIAVLTETQRRVLVALAENLSSNTQYTDTDIAENLGISRATIYRCRQNVDFGRALAIICREIVRGQTDSQLQNIARHGEKDWKASEFLLKFTGEYVPRQQSLNIQAKMDTRSPIETTDDLIDAFMRKLFDLGWSVERVAQRFIDATKR